ncbi:MAG TPA: hypothetical protein VI008_03125 [Rubrobacter sp.]|jgi:hypothetical protein
MSLPEATGARLREWAEGEEARGREKEELIGDLSQVMKAHGRDLAPI